MEEMSWEEFQEWIDNADPQELEVVGKGKHLQQFVDMELEEETLYKLQKDRPLLRPIRWDRMIDDELEGSERYQIRHKPPYALRVYDRPTERVDGYWYMQDQEWVDLSHLYMDEPADLIPRMQNIRQRLQGRDEQELDVALEIVDYVIEQLEQMSDHEVRDGE